MSTGSDLRESLETLEEELGGLKDGAKEVEGATEELDELLERLKAARESPEPMSGESYGQLLSDISKFGTDRMALTKPIEVAIQAATHVIGSTLGMEADFAFRITTKRFVALGGRADMSKEAAQELAEEVSWSSSDSAAVFLWWGRGMPELPNYSWWARLMKPLEDFWIKLVGTFGLSSPQRRGCAPLLVALMVAVLVLVGWLLFRGGGDDASNEPAVEQDDLISTEQTAEETTSEDSTSGDSSADASADSQADEVVVDPCVARRQEQIVLDLHSPDFSSGVSDPGDIVEMPIFFTSAPNAGNQENLTPTLVWSAVPPETTEIAVFIGLAPEEPWDEYREVDNIYEQLIPLSAEWLLAGLDPATTLLQQTSLSIPAPDGSILLGPPFQSTAVSEDRLIFGVVALCDRDVDRPPTIGSLKSDAIAVGQFRASPGQ